MNVRLAAALDPDAPTLPMWTTHHKPGVAPAMRILWHVQMAANGAGNARMAHKLAALRKSVA